MGIDQQYPDATGHLLPGQTTLKQPRRRLWGSPYHQSTIGSEGKDLKALTLDQRIERADILVKDFKFPNPLPGHWGFFSYSDASPAIGGGVGAFCWFSTREAMLDFAESVIPFNPGGPAGDDEGLLSVAVRVSELVEDARSGKVSLEEMRLRLNGVLVRYSQFEWFGTFEELLSGEHPWAQQIRQNFIGADRSDVNDSADGPVVRRIVDGEMKDFLAYLQDYGY